MSHLAHVNQTPTRRKRTPFKPQRNTLDKYFSAPKKNKELKPVNEDVKDNSVSRPKRKMQASKSVGIKIRKTDDSCEKTAKSTLSSSDTKLLQAEVQLKRINISRPNLNGIHHPKTTPSTNVSHDKGNTATCKTKQNRSESDDQLFQKENHSHGNTTPVKRSRTVNVTKVNSIASTGNHSIDLVVQYSMDDSVDIDSLGTPVKNQKLDYEFDNSFVEQSKSSDEVSNLMNTAQNKDGGSRQETLNNCYVGQQLHCEEKRTVSAGTFKEIVNSFCHSEFSKPYRKLSLSKLPQCHDFKRCKELHEGVQHQEVDSFHYGHVFNMMDDPLPNWLCDILPAISLVVTRNQYLRGDMLRIMFDYILNGPNEDLVWEIKTILESHWSLHPSCTDHMRQVYLDLLDRRYAGDSFFSKTDLVNHGVLTFVLEKLEKVLKSGRDSEDNVEIETESYGDEPMNCSESKVTFEVLEDRFNNLQPLFEEEQQKLSDEVDKIANISQIEKESVVLDECEVLNRLTIALEIIVNLFEDDFMICVSRLKSYMKEECGRMEPLVKYFIDDSFQSKILNYYMKTTNQSTWKQLSRLIGLVAETLHLFKHWEQKVWKYPNLNSDCENFVSLVFKEFSKGDWSESERLSRLQALRPRWLQQRVALSVANSHLNLDLSTGIEALVDIIHTHVMSPAKLKKDLEEINPDPEEVKQVSGKVMKNSIKKDKYGESRLHKLCHRKNATVEDVALELALPTTDINARDNHGWTPLHEAVNTCSLAKVKLLLEYQPPHGSGRKPVDVGVQNNDGITPLHEAVETNYPEICKLLVGYGGICLLRKKDNEGVTPLMLSRNMEVPRKLASKKEEAIAFLKKRREINKNFLETIRLQEQLNLDPSSVLKLSDSLIRICMVACEAFIADHHTWEVYQVLKYDRDYDKAPSQPWVAGSNIEILVEYKQHQHQFRKLRKILDKLAENPENSYLVRIWNERYLYRDGHSGNFT